MNTETVAKRQSRGWRWTKALCNFFFLTFSTIVFVATALISLALIYKCWTRSVSRMFIQDDADEEGLNEDLVILLTDPLVIALILIAVSGVLDVTFLLSWVWVVAPVWLANRKYRRNHSACSTYATLQVTLLSFVVKFITAAFILIVDAKYPDLHGGINVANKGQVEEDNHVLHEVNQDEDLLIASMKIYRQFQPALIGLYVLSSLLKAIFLRHYERLRNMPTPSYRGKVKAHFIEPLKALEAPVDDDDIDLGTIVEDEEEEDDYGWNDILEDSDEEPDCFPPDDPEAVMNYLNQFEWFKNAKTNKKYEYYCNFVDNRKAGLDHGIFKYNTI